MLKCCITVLITFTSGCVVSNALSLGANISNKIITPKLIVDNARQNILGRTLHGVEMRNMIMSTILKNPIIKIPIPNPITRVEGASTAFVLVEVELILAASRTKIMINEQ